MEFLLYIGAICFAACYIPQIVKIIKTKSVNDISPVLFIMSSIAYTTNLIYFVINWKWSMVVNYAPGLMCTISIIVMYYKYRRKNER